MIKTDRDYLIAETIDGRAQYVEIGSSAVSP